MLVTTLEQYEEAVSYFARVGGELQESGDMNEWPEDLRVREVPRG